MNVDLADESFCGEKTGRRANEGSDEELIKNHSESEAEYCPHRNA